MRRFKRNGRFGRSAHLLGLGAACLALGACANSNMASRVTPRDGVAVTAASGTHVAKRVQHAKTQETAARALPAGVKYSAVGLASWYGSGFHGRPTADGETFDMNSLTAAHPSLPIPCNVRVTNLANHRSIVVRVNDRGPYTGHRVIDVSAQSAKLLGFYGRGLAKVKVDYVGRAAKESGKAFALE
jgi:rare lipoprotein A